MYIAITGMITLAYENRTAVYVRCTNASHNFRRRTEIVRYMKYDIRRPGMIRRRSYKRVEISRFKNLRRD